MLQPWTDYFTMDNLPNEDLKIIAETIGLIPTVKLMCEFPGTTFVIPKNCTLKARIDYVKKHYNGSKRSRVELAQTCNFSENYIYKLFLKH